MNREKRKKTLKKVGKGKASLSVKLRNVVAGIVFVLILTVITSLYVVTRKERMDYTKREAESLLSGVSDSIFYQLESYKELSRLIMMEDSLAQFLRAEKEEVTTGMINNARYDIMRILNVTENVDTVFVVREDDQYLTTALATNQSSYRLDFSRMAEEEWREPILKGRGNASISVNANKALYKTNGKPLITINRAVYDLLRQKRTGIMLMNVSDKLLERLVLENARGKDLCILSTDGTYLSGNEALLRYLDQDFTGEETVHKTVRMGDEPVIISGCGVEGTPIVILCASGLGGKALPLGVGYALLLLFGVFTISLFVGGTFITRQITTPVFRLTSAMEENRQQGKLEKINVKLPKNELGMLEDEYNNMIEHVNDLIRRLIEKEKTLQNAEMRVLHEQIKPHFLYNSLETIGWMAMDAGADKVHDALETLGSFYRNFLSKGDREVTLRREISIVQDYLSLQKLRYGDIISDEYDVAKDTENCIVPKLILQPLIENSIYHGIRLKGEAGTIRITSFLEGEVLHVIVRDTGVGMSQEKIDQILNSDQSEPGEVRGEASESFGLWGTIERIRCFCDSDDVVKIRSDEGEYTEIEFIFPHAKKEKGIRENVQSDDHR